MNFTKVYFFISVIEWIMAAFRVEESHVDKIFDNEASSYLESVLEMFTLCYSGETFF